MTVYKPSAEGSSLEFECDATEQGGIQVHRMRVVREDDDDDDDGDGNEEVGDGDKDEQDDDDDDDEDDISGATAEYEGPKFDDLDDALQEKFMQYLEVGRWVGGEVGGYRESSSYVVPPCCCCLCCCCCCCCCHCCCD